MDTEKGSEQRSSRAATGDDRGDPVTEIPPQSAGGGLPPGLARAVESAAPGDALSFERFLADLSAEFVNVQAERAEREVERGLRRLAEYLEFDRTSLSCITEGGQLRVMHSYAVEGVLPLPLGDIKPEIAWYAREMKARRVVRCTGPDDLPAVARAERDFVRDAGIRSHVGIPIVCAGMPLCVLCISTFTRPFEIPVAMIPRLRLIGEVFAGALARRDAELRLREMQAELARVARVSTVGQLAASIAHELNHPLCAIMVNAQAAVRLLAAPTPDLAEVRAALADIVADSRRAADVVDQSRALVERRKVRVEPVDVNDAVADVVTLVGGDAVIRGVTLDVSPADGLPPVLTDRVQVQQILLNLVVNALEATADAPASARVVSLRTAAGANGSVRVTVTDTGPGIPPHIAGQIFEPFFTTKPHGLGMGLTIVRSLVNAHGGAIGVDKAEGGTGAAVWFELPALPPAG